MLEGPVGQRVDLDHSRVVNFDNIEVSALASLATTATGNDCNNTQVCIGTLSRFDLGDIVVEFLVGLPKLFAVLAVKVLGIVTTLGLVGVNGKARVSLLDGLNKIISLLECVQCVEVNQVNVGLDGAVQFRDHVVDGKTSKSKGSCLEEAGQSHDAPFQNVCIRYKYLLDTFTGW